MPRIKGQKEIRLQILTTQRCTAQCNFCDKAVGLARLPKVETTTEDIRVAVDELIRQGIRVNRFTISGGEPVLCRDLQGILDQLDRMPGAKRVLTTGMDVIEPLRAKIRLPKGASWVVSPLDNQANPLSGKNNRKHPSRKRYHLPYWLSPADIGLNATWEKCENRGWCGKGLDGQGWSMCGQAPILGAILGIDPYMPIRAGGDIMAHVNTPIPEMCKHCQYGLTKKERKGVYEAFDRGELPEMSETFAGKLRSEDGKVPSLPIIQ